MIDQRLLIENPKLIEEGLQSRGMDIDLAPLQEFCKDLKELEERRNNLQAQGNLIGKEVGQKIKKGISQNSEEISNLRIQGNQIKDVGVHGWMSMVIGSTHTNPIQINWNYFKKLLDIVMQML